MIINHTDAVDELNDAAELLREFLDTIYQSLDGDHPEKERVRSWLERYDKYGVD